MIEDSSSIIDSDPDIAGISHTPSLALSVPSPADDWEPDSPAPEILETQERPATDPLIFAVKIPHSAIDKAEYASYRGSQVTNEQELTSPLVPPSKDTFRGCLKTPARNQTRRSQLSPSQQLRESLRCSQRSLFQALESQSQPSRKVEVPASSDLVQDSDRRPAIKSSASILHESGSASNSSSPVARAAKQNLAPRQAIEHSDGKETTSPSALVLSSAQPALTESIASKTHAQSLDTIEVEHPDTQTSSPLVIQSQLLAPRWSFTPPIQSRSSHRRPSAPRLGVFELDQNDIDRSARLPSSRMQPARDLDSSAKMDVPPLRQSPRLQPATLTPGSRSPRPSPRPLAREQQVRHAMSAQKPDEASVPTARTTQSAAHGYGSHLTPDARPPNPSRLSHEYSSAQSRAYDEPAPSSDLMPQLPIQQSIEEEPSSSSAEEHVSIASKASSSQVSLLNERVIPQVDGVSLPVKPVIGPAEYAIPLPAEGKVQSSYGDLINAKKKLILKFIHRRDSVGSANGHPNRTIERNEMIELMEILNDAVTHFDLSLPGMATQYSIQSQEATAYAQYAGSKFVFLGHVIDILMRVDCTLIIVSKAGHSQDLLVDFLKMKKARVHRFDRPGSARAVTPDVHQATLKVDVISTSSDFEINISPRPALMIAFDSSFDSQSEHIARIRELNSLGRNRLLPVLHLLVQNSAEHVDRCLRKAMPSPQRLKLLVRATYQARTNLGGSPSYVPAIGDEPEDRPMDIHDLQRGVRKSPNRKLNMVAAIVARAALSIDFEENWTLGDIPPVEYEELQESPPKSSRVTTTANTATGTPRDGRARSLTPLSRAGTPSGRKRLLDVESASSALTKRVRLSPARDLTPTVEAVRDQDTLYQLREQLKAVTSELATEREARLKAEEARDYAQKRVQEYTRDHESLLGRYEKRRAKTRDLDTKIQQLKTAADFNKTKHERTAENNTKLKEQVSELKTELAAAREDLKNVGGDVGALEGAREVARAAKDANAKLEKSIENAKRDFEFTRQQYQQASNRAAELGGENSELEEQVAALKIQASDEKRRLRETNTKEAYKQDISKIEQLEQENRALQVMIKKMEDKMKVLEKGRGVQTRGSSAQPPGSPGIGSAVVHGTRSRQGSPAPGTVMSASRDAREAMHGGVGRVSGLRNERAA